MSSPIAEVVVELVVREGVRLIGRHELALGSYTIGSAQEAQILLKGNRVAPIQAQIDLREDGAMVINNDPQFPMLLNEQELQAQRPTPLNNGDRLIIHAYRMIFRLLDRPISEPPPPLPPPLPLPPPPPERVVEWLAPLESRFSRYVSDNNTSRYIHDLPIIYQSLGQGFLGQYLMIFEAIWEPFEQRQDQIDLYFDPRTCPAEFLPILEHWLATPWCRYWPDARRRQLLAQIVPLYHWRGTRETLERVIALYTGVDPLIDTHPTEPFVVTIDLQTSVSSPSDWEILIDLIERFKPAHIAYTFQGSSIP